VRERAQGGRPAGSGVTLEGKWKGGGTSQSHKVAFEELRGWRILKSKTEGKAEKIESFQGAKSRNLNRGLRVRINR